MDDIIQNSKKRKQQDSKLTSQTTTTKKLVTKEDTKTFLDDLFASLPAKKKKIRDEALATEVAQRLVIKAEKEEKRLAAEHLAKLEEEGKRANRIRAPDSPLPLRVDKEGFPIFDEKTLGVGDKEGKFTKDCPFDCFCCFG